MSIKFPQSARVQLVLGTFKTGKTRSLVQRVDTLLANGAPAHEIIVVGASPDACCALEARLDTLIGVGCGVRVVTARELALGVLSHSDAIAAMGRRPRLLARFEVSFLMEDMKVSGLRPKRISELTNFFYRCWADLADFEDGWMVYKEEEMAHSLLKSLLRSYNAYLEPELSNSAVRYLTECAEARQSEQASYVLVDDYQCLSRASQYLVNLLASKELFVAANPRARVQTFDSYPYTAGIDELRMHACIAENVVLDECGLPEDVFEALLSLGSLAGADGVDVHEGVVERAKRGTEACLEVVDSEDPVDECEKVATWVRCALQEGIDLHEIAVVVPNRTWERNMAVRLGKAGIRARRSSERGDVGGDVRYGDLSYSAQIVTLITLAADATDASALRAWCGFGEYLTCRQLFAEVYEHASAKGESMADAVGRIVGEVLDGDIAGNEDITYKNEAKKIAAAFERLQVFLDTLQGLAGMELVETASQLVCGERALPSPIVHLFDEVESDDDATVVSAKASQALHFPHVPNGNAVCVTTARRMVGRDVKAVAITGMVSGFVPDHSYFDRTKKSPDQAASMLARDAEAYGEAMGQGVKKCALFKFRNMRGLDAERHDVRVDRFYVRGGIRLGRVHQSLLIDQMQGVEIPEIW